MHGSILVVYLPRRDLYHIKTGTVYIPNQVQKYLVLCQLRRSLNHDIFHIDCSHNNIMPEYACQRSHTLLSIILPLQMRTITGLCRRCKESKFWQRILSPQLNMLIRYSVDHSMINLTSILVPAIQATNHTSKHAVQTLSCYGDRKYLNVKVEQASAMR